jgi:hypothetical protein
MSGQSSFQYIVSTRIKTVYVMLCNNQANIQAYFCLITEYRAVSRIAVSNMTLRGCCDDCATLQYLYIVSLNNITLATGIISAHRAPNPLTTNDQHTMTTVTTIQIHKYYHVRYRIPKQ